MIIKMKKRLYIILLIIGMMCSICACAGEAEEEFDGVTLTIMGKTTDMEKNYMLRIFELYEESTGNRLELIKIEDAEFESAAAKAFADGNAPDILMHFNNSGLTKLGVSDNFYYLTEESWVDVLTEGARAYCQDSEGNILGLPFWESSVSGCYYNKTLLDSLGMKPASTQTEFDLLCQTLTDIGYTPLCWSVDSGSWVYQFGLDPIFADDPLKLEQLNSGQINYSDIPEVTDMVEWIDNAAGRGWFGETYLTNDWDDLSSTMSSGKAVMIFIWDTWFYTDFEENGTYTKEDFALMPVFMNTVDGGTYEGGNLNMMMVNKNGDQVEEALEFLSFCGTAENYNKAFEGVSTVSCFQDQTTNIQSDMVTNAMASINAHQRTSTAEPKILGYSAEDMSSAFRELHQGNIDVAGCVELMDQYRTAAME